MKRVIIAVFLSFFLIVSCSGKKDEPKVKDNITAKKPMAPIAEAQDIKIDEGNKYFLNGNFEKSIEYYSKALDENRSVAYYNIGVAYYLLGRYEESEKYFRQAIDVKNDLKDAYVNLAVTLLRQKKVGEAVEVISKIEPTNAKEYQIMAEIYTIARDYPKAYYYFEKFSKSKDPLPSGFINYGIFLKAMGDNDKGDKILNETIKKLESSEFKDYEDFYQLAVGYFALKMYDKAILNAKYAINLKKTYEALEIMVKSYEAIGKYDLAALVAESMVSINPDVITYEIYIKNLIKSGNYQTAENVLKEVLSKYPLIKSFYKLYHNLAILTGDLIKANLVAKRGYENIKDDIMAYFYAKHSILYDSNFENGKKLIGIIRDHDKLNILNAFFALKFNRIAEAEKYLSNVSDKTDYDYNFANAFIMLTRKDYENASRFIEGMDDIPEKVFYKVVLYYNTKNFQKLADISLKNVQFVKNIKRYPKVTYLLTPTMEDLNFAYYFDNSFESYIRFILTPIFINPEEMTNYLATGYQLLNQSDQLLALNELKKSVNLSYGIRHNNEGVKAILNAEYEKADKELTEAANYLGDNPIVYYNIGLLFLNMGNIDKAYQFFDNVLLNNKFIFPAYLGKAICLHLMGEDQRVINQYDMLISNYNILDNSEKKQAAPYIYTKLLAMVGAKRYYDVINSVKSSDPELLKSIKELAIYLQKRDDKSFLEANLVFFRVYQLKNAVSYYLYDKFLKNVNRNDRFVDYTLKNIAKQKNLDYMTQNYKYDKYLLIEEIKYDLLNRSDAALTKLRELARIDSKDPNLFKLSLYYFMLKGDIINADVSYQNLKNNNMDKLAIYYQMLYHFMTYNRLNMVKSINKYIEVAPNDYRGYLVEILRGFRENNLQLVYDSVIKISSKDFSNKILPMEMVINGI